ncbi:DUF4368 domain-containing protein [Roseburia intestinalis]|nr:DUF4368 domain-containing protein [Roseburia intestinalis]
MAVTKTHPIKSTLKAAIDYILNPEKTDGKLLASSFGCGLETADIEFAWTREAAGDRGTHLGRHLIQSFAVGETTPEEAHKIGMELAGAVLGGKYEFVLTTHVDKDHLHNHLIFNAVSFVDYKKYHSNKQSYHFIRRTSDRICKEHGLSVVVPGQDKGKSYAEYTAEKQGTSYKAKLKTAIDTLIPQVKDFDELLRRLQEMGYEIKQGKYISFRAAGQERFTRTKTLGAAYTEEAIKERIKGVYVAKTKTLREDKKIRLVVDLENSIKAQQSAGYERWAKIHNLKQAAKSMNFLTENKIEYYSELESKIADIMTAHDAAAKAVKEVEQRISVKIKSAYRARFQQGKFMGTTAPYGYIKDPADHNHLLIDDKVAHVVKEIFDLALKGNGVAKICRHLNKQHILRPAAYAAERGETGFERHFEGNEDKRYIWSGNSVRSILRSPIYAGNLVGYKRIAANMKSKKRPSKLPEEWEVIPNTHEGIVTQEEFDIVQQLITSRRLPQNKGGFVNIFAGVIKCVDCGCALRAMNVHRRKRPEIIDCVQYSCNNYARNGRSECSAHNIEARDLFNAVLADINCFADMAVNDEKAVRAIEKRLTETDQSRAKALEKERKKLNKRLAELDRLFSSLYEDKVMERITERNFEMMSGKYQKEQLEIEARLKEVTETLNESYEKSRGIRDFLALIRNYQGLKELDATVINALIDKILVSEREKMADGTVKQEIKIYYKFIGFVDELHIIPTKRWAAMPAKNCTVCGVEYVPGSGASRYCPACAKKIRREKSNESKRRSREQKRIACMNCPQKMTD